MEQRWRRATAQRRFQPCIIADGFQQPAVRCQYAVLDPILLLLSKGPVDVKFSSAMV